MSTPIEELLIQVKKHMDTIFLPLMPPAVLQMFPPAKLPPENIKHREAIDVEYRIIE